VILKAAQDAGIRIVLLQTYYEKAGLTVNSTLAPAQKHFISPSLQSFWDNFDNLNSKLDKSMQSLGVAAHSFRAVDFAKVIELKKESDRREIPFHIHLEEQPQEIIDCQEALNMRPAEGVLKHLNPNERVTLVHCTHTKTEHFDELREYGVNISIAPLTEGHLGDGIPDIQTLTSEKNPFYVCLGTDCNARICFMEEMRWLLYGQQIKSIKLGCPSLEELNGETEMSHALFRCATINGARSLGLSQCGSLEVGKYLDLFTIDLTHPSLAGWKSETLLDAIVFGTSGDAIIAGVWVGGKLRYSQKVVINAVEEITAEKTEQNKKLA